MHTILKVVRRAAIVLAGLLLLAILLMTVTPQGRTAFRTLLFIPQVLPAFPVKPQEWVTDDPVRHEIDFPIAEGTASADLYVPSGPGPHPAVLFFLGVVPPDRDESRVVALADGLARSGVVVMIPWLQSQIEHRISPGDVESLVRGFQYLHAHESVDQDRIGVGGICTGASLTAIAAQDERIRDDVRFVNSFAGYYDAVDMVRAIGSRSRFHGELSAPWDPDSLTMRIFTSQMIEGLTDPEDRELLTRALVDRGEWREEELESLSRAGRAVYGILEGGRRDEIDALIADLPPSMMDLLAEISPSTGIEDLKARVLIMHDRADRLVPSEESRRFADALGEDAETYHTEFSFFQSEVQVHVDGSEGVGFLGFVREAFKLYLHMYNVLRELS